MISLRSKIFIGITSWCPIYFGIIWFYSFRLLHLMQPQQLSLDNAAQLGATLVPTWVPKLIPLAFLALLSSIPTIISLVLDNGKKPQIPQ